MTIASELTKLNTNLTNAYTAVDGKGGTLPSAQNFDSLATAISSIPSGSTPVITSLSITPTTSAQTITAPSGTDGYSPVNVAAVTASIDANISASNIKKDVTILGVTGSYEGSGGGGETDYATILQIENTMKGTSYVQADVEAEACDDISYFLYGTANS